MTSPDTTNTAPQAVKIAELLKIADTQAEQDGTRKTDTARLYASGRLNIADGGHIKPDTAYTAKIADTTLILYADDTAKRKTNRKTNSTDILYNLTADLRKRNAYTQAVKNGQADGVKSFKDYTITTIEEDGNEYYIIDLNEHAPQAEQTDGQADGTDEQTDGTADA